MQGSVNVFNVVFLIGPSKLSAMRLWTTESSFTSDFLPFVNRRFFNSDCSVLLNNYIMLNSTQLLNLKKKVKVRL